MLEGATAGIALELFFNYYFLFYFYHILALLNSRGAQPQACRPSAFRLGVSVSGQYRSVALWLDAVLLLTLLVGKNFLFYSPAPLTIRTAS
jgi:hypothetical protein